MSVKQTVQSVSNIVQGRHTNGWHLDVQASDYPHLSGWVFVFSTQVFEGREIKRCLRVAPDMTDERLLGWIDIICADYKP